MEKFKKWWEYQVGEISQKVEKKEKTEENEKNKVKLGQQVRKSKTKIISILREREQRKWMGGNQQNNMQPRMERDEFFI